MEKLLSLTRLLSILLLFLHLQILCLANNSSFGCVGNERAALLKFKQSLVDPTSRLSSWEEDSNCCSNWEGVRCHITGHVVKLDLRSIDEYTTRTVRAIIDIRIPYYYRTVLSSTSLDSSLLELKYLNYLDLSGNNFNTKIPTFLGSMKQLHHLYLSRAGFHGVIPHNLGNLSNLQTLDIGHNHGLIAAGDLEWISNLPSLEYLDLGGIDLSRQKDLIKVLSMLPSLVVLNLRANSLDSSNLPQSCVNSTTLLSHVKYLDMSYNKLNGEIPCFLHNMTSLQFLDLTYNQIQHSTEWISELIGTNCHLKSLNLSDNEFHGGMSGAFKNLSRCRAYELENLNLRNNSISGSIPDSIGNMSALKELDISYNELSGSIPESIGKLSALVELDVSLNKLSGSVPDSIGNLSALRRLYLRFNPLSGELPISLGQLSNLEIMSMQGSFFNGTLSEAHFSKLSKLKLLQITTSKSMKFNVGYNWVPAFQVVIFGISSCKLEGDQFPPWLQTQKALTSLELSNCGIFGTLPKWLGSMTNLTKLYLSGNHISGGPIMELPSGLYWLDLSGSMITHFPNNISLSGLYWLKLSDNMMTDIPSNIGHMLPNLQGLFLARNVINGSLPHSLCEMKHLRYLHLSDNNLSGDLLDCWQNFPDLEDAILSSNDLSGVIPKSIGGAYNLQKLKLDNNRLRGPLPSTLMNCSSLEILDVGENKLFGTIPEWIGKTNLKVLRLRNNQFHGVIPQELCQASQLQILDLGINRLTGYVPNCFQNISGMKFLGKYNFSISFAASLYQVLKGLEMEYSSYPALYLSNLDLSCNNLTGGIPSELTALVGLKGLNLSHNNLHGEIPRNIGGLKSLESLDLSNNHLFGKIPESLANLTFLSRLNLSNNDLSGQIPTGNQLRTLEDGPSIYAGNPLLCGDPLPKKCHNSSDVIPKQPNGENHVPDTIDQLCFYAFVIAGFASGLWGFFGVLFFKRSWRYAYFRVIEAMIMKMMGRWIIS